MRATVGLILTYFLIGCSSSPSSELKPPPTFDQLVAEIKSCDANAKGTPSLICSNKKFRLYYELRKDSSQYPRFPGKSPKDGLNFLVQAKDQGHLAANFHYALHLMGEGSKEAYPAALKARELFQKIEKDPSLPGHDPERIQARSFKKLSLKEEFDALVAWTEILDPQRGSQLGKSEIWRRLEPLTSIDPGVNRHTSRDIHGIKPDRVVKRYKIDSKDFFPLFVQAAELKVPDAIFMLAKVYFSRQSTVHLKTTPLQDFQLYQKYMDQARGMNHPEALMDRHQLLPYIENRQELMKATPLAFADVRKAAQMKYPPAMRALGLELAYQHESEKNPAKQAKLKKEALENLLAAKQSGEGDLDMTILLLQDRKAYLAKKEQEDRIREETNRRIAIAKQNQQQINAKIMQMLQKNQVSTQSDVDFICANTFRKPVDPYKTREGDNCDWANSQLTEKKHAQQRLEASKTEPWGGFTYTKETTDRYNRSARESKEKNDLNQFKRNLDHKIRSK